jgi:hypothetical protein
MPSQQGSSSSSGQNNGSSGQNNGSSGHNSSQGGGSSQQNRSSIGTTGGPENAGIRRDNEGRPVGASALDIFNLARSELREFL